MRAIVQDRYGDPGTLSLGSAAKPEPGPDEVLIRVHAAAVNAYDWHLMRGDPYLARLTFGVRRPRTRVRGRDFAGQVVGTGPGVTRFRPGDQVFGEADGAFAEYVSAGQDVLAAIPDGLTFEQAAALPLAGNTALMALRDAGRVRAGHHVLINGASGGVGTFAVQIGKAFGARVTAVCSARNSELARSIGADHVVDYATEDFTRSGERADVVLDLVGNHRLAALRRAVAPGGTLVLSGGGASEGGSLFGPMALLLRARATARFARGQRLTVLTATPSGANLTALADLASRGRLTPVVDRTYPLAEVPDAIRYMETEHARGKVVITVR
ncbi:NAD(P)-dependent alcohol dehydrogenase [Actinacidiphila alni]|uniref:NAD(P)-dependent alcohol dehydrogenase n=1 Tax=Actinacidiphila alni TaxID=380248 RepID=UPI0033EC1B41